MLFALAVSSVKMLFWGGIMVAFTQPLSITRQFAISLMIVFLVLSDILDGIIVSKKFGEKGTRIRRMYDNITDVIVSHTVCIVLLSQQNWSLLWYIPLFVRDVALFLLAALLLQAKTVVFPGYAHKAARGGLAVAAIAMLWGFYGGIFLTLAYVVFYISLFDYYGAFRLFRIHHNGREVADINGLIEFHMPNRFANIRHIITDPKRLLESGVNEKNLIADKHG